MTKKAARKSRKANRKAGRKKDGGNPALLLAAPSRGVPEPAGLAAGSAAPSLLEKARARWEHGAWSELLALDGPALESDPERGKLALLLAAAHSQIGEMAEARRLARQALLWGCSRAIVSRVLLSTVQNSLARVTAAVGEDPSAYFEKAIRLVQPQADAALLGRTRQIRELGRMGLLPEAAAALESAFGLVRDAPGRATGEGLARIAEQIGALKTEIAARGASSSAVSPASPSQPAADPARIAIYRGLPAARLANFRYLDVKSLPRTGLHFMRNSFESILRDNFSFCEWYTEPGCCRQMPCAVTGYATEGQDRPMLRMVKSHDFDLADPAFPTGGPLRRLILIRDPLYLLTSWWTLQMLYLRADLLKRHGIMTDKLSFAHGPHVLRSAYRLIDAEAEMPPSQALAGWLGKQTPYVTGFVAKWQAAALADGPGTRILRYRETPAAILDIIDEIAGQLDDAARARLVAFRDRRDSGFVARQSPFEGPSSRISAYMRENAALFLAAARTILEQDETGLLQGA